MRPLSPPITKNLAMAVSTKAETWSSTLFYILFKIRMFTLTQIQYHTKVLSIIYPAAKISKSLQTSWMKIINSTTTKKKLQIENITQRKFQIVSQ